MEQLTKNQAGATSQEAVQNQNEPQLRYENAPNDKSVEGALNPTYQAGLRRDAVQQDSDAGGEACDVTDRRKTSCRMRDGHAVSQLESADEAPDFDNIHWEAIPGGWLRFHVAVA